MPAPRKNRDLPPSAGVTLTDDGAEFCVYAGHASAVWVCLYDEEPGRPGSFVAERRVELTERAYGYWYGHIDGVRPGQRYLYRADGPWDPMRGMRYNPAKAVIDPYTRVLEGDVMWRPEVFGHPVNSQFLGDSHARDTRDSAAFMPRCVVIDESFDFSDDVRLDYSLADSLIYEVHLKNLTKLHPLVPPHLRGTYAGLAHPAVVEYLRSLGVTAVELLPVHAFTSEPRVLRHGLTNHWGYNTLAYFAPHAAYASVRHPQGVVDEFKTMVKTLHRNGIEVILDVVYNHTAEWSNLDGPTLSWRGLDNHTYYRLDDRGHDIDVTGCGNTINTRHPVAFQMAMDSLRYWAEQCHVDGFRFDLAVANARSRNEAFDPDAPFLMSLRTDPTLSRLKLIAEPWDIGIHGWRTGQFPPPFSEWNDRFRDTVRTFWLVDRARDAVGQGGAGVRDLATRLSGSEDMFGLRDRGTVASINFVAAHDGFTTIDLTAYNVKHNSANAEDNKDGANDNRSYNHGVEGPTLDPAINEARRRSARNLLATLFLASGVPMLNAGDEYGRSQRGNNNAYCQDNEVTWFRWDLRHWERDLLATVRFLSRLRREQPVLRQRTFFTGRPTNDDGSADLTWFDAAGQPMERHRWEDPHCRTLQMALNGAPLKADSLLVVVHGGALDTRVTLPVAPHGVRRRTPWRYELLWDSVPECFDPDGPPIFAQALSGAGDASSAPAPTPVPVVPGAKRADKTRSKKAEPPTEVVLRAASLQVYRIV